MKSAAQVTAPDGVELTLSITATVAEWRNLLDTLSEAHGWPQWKFRSFITDAIHKTVLRVESTHEAGP